MWWLRGWGLAALLGLAACGFAPAFAPSGPGQALYGQIALNDPETRNGFEFIQHFEQRLGRAVDARYDLAISIATASASLGISPAGATTRYNLTGSVTWTLTDRANGQQLATGSEENFVGWSATGVTISAVNAETDANARLMRILADQLVARLVALAPGLADSR
jgi:LPS-assembly lipoprotein